MAKEKYGLTCDYKFTVGIYDLDNHVVKFVDSIDDSTKTATWNAEMPALAMTKERAVMLQTGLLCNGYMALVIEVPDYVMEMLKNTEKEVN